MSKHHLTFNGKELIWPGHGRFKATSGNVDVDEKTHKVVHDYRNAKFQDLSELGPIPEGQYTFLAVIDSGSAFDSKGELDSRQGIEQIAPEGSTITTLPNGKTIHVSGVVADWGHNRVRLNVIHIDHRKAHNRNGFYLHDSHKGHTHGCVEVSHSFFDRLRAFAKDQAKLPRRSRHTTLTLVVKYPSASASTNGGTAF